MSDLLFQDLSTVASDKNAKPVTLAAATTIAPTTFVTFVTGTTPVGTLTPPTTGHATVCLVFTDSAPGTTITTGNLAIASTPVKNKALFLVYDQASTKWYPSY